MKRSREVIAGLLSLLALVLFFTKQPRSLGSITPIVIFSALMLWAIVSPLWKMSIWDRAKQMLPWALGVLALYESSALADSKRFDEATYTLVSGELGAVIVWLIIEKSKSGKP